MILLDLDLLDQTNCLGSTLVSFCSRKTPAKLLLRTMEEREHRSYALGDFCDMLSLSRDELMNVHDQEFCTDLSFRSRMTFYESK